MKRRHKPHAHGARGSVAQAARRKRGYEDAAVAKLEARLRSAGIAPPPPAIKESLIAEERAR